MDQDNKEILRKIYDLEQKNNKMLISIRRSIFWGGVFRVLYWIVIVAATVGIYYYIQPYIDGIISTYSGFKDSIFGAFQ